MSVPYEFTPPTQHLTHNVDVAVPTPALPTGPLSIEVEPGHYIDLSKAIEIDDQPAKGSCYVLFPAPTWDGQGPHGVLLTGEARILTLGYWQLRARHTRALLLSLFES